MIPPAECRAKPPGVHIGLIPPSESFPRETTPTTVSATNTPLPSSTSSSVKRLRLPAQCFKLRSRTTDDGDQWSVCKRSGSFAEGPPTTRPTTCQSETQSASVGCAQGSRTSPNRLRCCSCHRHYSDCDEADKEEDTSQLGLFRSCFSMRHHHRRKRRAEQLCCRRRSLRSDYTHCCHSCCRCASSFAPSRCTTVPNRDIKESSKILKTPQRDCTSDDASFYTALSSFGLSAQRGELLRSVSASVSTEASKNIQASSEPSPPSTTASLSSSSTTESCSGCGFACHSKYDPIFPLLKCKSDDDEIRILAERCCGHWVTDLARSESLDSQYRVLGLGMIKRSVMNRLAVPLSMFLEDGGRVLHCWIHTPLGIRHMHTDLVGRESVDEDPDAGTWKGTSKVVDYHIDWFCKKRTVRAIQQTRRNSKLNATSIETRCVLPVAKDGCDKIMLFNFTMIPANWDKPPLSADRVLKFVSDKIPGLTENQ